MPTPEEQPLRDAAADTGRLAQSGASLDKKKPVVAGEERLHYKEDQEGEGSAPPPQKGCRCKASYFFPFPVQFLAQPIMLKEVAKKKYGADSFWALPVADQAELIRNALKARDYIVDPTSDFMRSWDLITLVALFFVGTVTPFEVCFLPASTGAAQTEVETPIDTLFYVNWGVNAIFLIDMVLQFVVKVKVRDGKRYRWLRTRGEIVPRYLKGWFAIDLLSIIPFDMVLAPILGAKAKKLKAIKVVRLLRLLKLARVLKASRMLSRWENELSLSYAERSLYWCILQIIVSCHFMACLWGLVGRYQTELMCPDFPGLEDPVILDLAGEEIPYTPLSAGSGSYIAAGQGLYNSWIVSLVEGKTSPDEACNPLQVYFWSLHFAVMTISSIGYGDMGPQSETEYIACIFCMMSGGILWAYVIGNLCGIASSSDPQAAEFRETYDNMNEMMSDIHVTLDLKCRVREYYRECQHVNRVRGGTYLKQMLSKPLQNLVAQNTYVDWVKQVYYFRFVSKQFLIEVCGHLDPALFAPREFFPQYGRMWLVTAGAACRKGIVFVPGSVFGEDMILDSFLLQERSTALALNFCEVLCLQKDHLMQVCLDFPKDARLVRKAAVRMAVTRGVMAYCRNERLMHARDNDANVRAKIKKSATAFQVRGGFLAQEAFDLQSSNEYAFQQFRIAQKLFGHWSLFKNVHEHEDLQLTAAAPPAAPAPLEHPTEKLLENSVPIQSVANPEPEAPEPDPAEEARAVRQKLKSVKYWQDRLKRQLNGEVMDRLATRDDKLLKLLQALKIDSGSLAASDASRKEQLKAERGKRKVTDDSVLWGSPTPAEAGASKKANPQEPSSRKSPRK